MSDNTTANFVSLLLKIGGMLLFFLLSQFIIESIFSNQMGFFINYFWFFVLAGLIPANIARIKGESFWIWWVAGTFFPIISLFYAIDISNQDETSE